MKNQNKKPSFLNIFSPFGAKERLRQEKARLEAFLSAVPGEYCGFASDGSIVYSQGFCDAIGASSIENFIDIQNQLSPEDSMSFEGLFERLSSNDIPFTINVQDSSGDKTLKLSGTRGNSLSGDDYFNILWLEDMTELKNASDKQYKEQFDLQDALDALSHPVWIRGEEQEIVWCNAAYAKIVNSLPSEIIEQQKEIILSSRKRKPSEKNLLFGKDLALKALQENCMQVIKIHEVIGGSRILLKISEMPLNGKNMSVGIAENLTEEERILDEVKNNQLANRALLEQLRSAIAIYGADHRLEFYNSAFSQLWDLDDGWLNKRPKLGDVMEKLRETRRLPEQADFKSYKKSWLDMFTSLIDPCDDMLYLPDGSALRMLVVPHKLGGVMMTFEDVTSRLALESSYNTLIAVQKETLDNLAEAVCVFGGDGRLKLWNPAFGKLWSLDPESLDSSQHVSRIVDKMSGSFGNTEWSKIRELLISIALDRSVNNGRLECKDQILVDYSTMPLPDGGVLITYTDVTDSVRVEKALREKNAALETAEKLKLDFLTNVSYQLRTPLNAIMGFNELLSQELFGSLNGKQKEYTHDINAASIKLLNLINDILDLSTIEAGQMNLDIEKVSIKNMIENIMELVQDWARKENIEVSLQCPANIGRADIDESRIKQAIINLVRNSIAHTKAGGCIDLSARRQGDNIKISVKDNGNGIAKGDQQRILRPFERIDSKQFDRGAGLGLSLVHNIVNLHGGSFDLDSEFGRGTTIEISLPKNHE